MRKRLQNQLPTKYAYGLQYLKSAESSMKGGRGVKRAARPADEALAEKMQMHRTRQHPKIQPLAKAF